MYGYQVGIASRDSRSKSTKCHYPNSEETAATNYVLSCMPVCSARACQNNDFAHIQLRKEPCNYPMQSRDTAPIWLRGTWAIICKISASYRKSKNVGDRSGASEELERSSQGPDAPNMPLLNKINCKQSSQFPYYVLGNPFTLRMNGHPPNR